MKAVLNRKGVAGAQIGNAHVGRPVFSLVRPYTAMRDIFRLLAITNLILLPVAVIAFGERFQFWAFPLSDLGLPLTPGGQRNHASMVVFALNMVAGSACMIAYGYSCLRTAALPGKRAKVALASVAATGFLVGIFPHEPFQVLHMAGCAAMIGALWFLANLFSVELVRLGRRRQAWRVQAVLQLTVLPYAAAYFLGLDIKQVLQKFAIAGLFVSLSVATRLLREAVLTNEARVAAWNNQVAGNGPVTESLAKTLSSRQVRG